MRGKAMNDFHYAGAFVVQFRTATDFGANHVEGRIEHIASGGTAHFESSSELLAAIERMWTNALANVPAREIDRGA